MANAGEVESASSREVTVLTMSVKVSSKPPREVVASAAAAGGVVASGLAESDGVRTVKESAVEVVIESGSPTAVPSSPAAGSRALPTMFPRPSRRPPAEDVDDELEPVSVGDVELAVVVSCLFTTRGK